MSTNPLSAEATREMALSICMNTGLLIMAEWVSTWDAAAEEKRAAGDHQAAKLMAETADFWRRIVEIAEEQR